MPSSFKLFTTACDINVVPVQFVRTIGNDINDLEAHATSKCFYTELSQIGFSMLPYPYDQFEYRP